MIPLLDRNSTKLTISEFYANYELNKYDFGAPYQRKSNVWTEEKQSFLIDTIFKNYPIPPIFMHPKVSNKGKTTYIVVDGKQRLESIIAFIEDRITLPSYFSEDSIFKSEEERIQAELLNEKKFSEIQNDPSLEVFLKQFWTYSINIDYFYEEKEDLINNIFDRLNRNGVPLSPQELRNARYNSTCLLQTIKELAESSYWTVRLSKLKDERMENEEFIAEIFLLTCENKILDSSPDIIDALYKKYSTNECEENIKLAKAEFIRITEFIIKLELDYDNFKRLSWTTHLYGLYSFAWHCIKKNISPEAVKDKLKLLYMTYFTKASTEGKNNLKDYKESCSSNTRSKIQRTRRLDAILDFCNMVK